MLSSHFGSIFLLIATIVVAEAPPSIDWQLAFNNGADLTTPDVDWTLSDTPLTAEEEDSLKSDIFQSSFDNSNNLDDAEFFMKNDNDDPENQLLADASPHDECSSSFDPAAGKSKRQLGRRNTMCSSSDTFGTPTSFPSSTVGEPSDFDRLYCPVSSILITSFFICSSPNPAFTVPAALFYTLYDSTRSECAQKTFPPFSTHGQ